MLSVAVFFLINTRRGWMCRWCGLATYRAQNGRTLVRCWWGVGLLGFWIVLLANRLRLRRVLRLSGPEPTPGVKAPSPMPFNPGRPVLSRFSGIFGLVCFVLAYGAIAFGVVELATR